MLTLEVIVRGSSNFIGFRDICSKALLDAGFVVMLLLVLHLWGDLLEIGWRSDHFAASLFYYRISRGPKGSNISTSFIYSNSVHRLGVMVFPMLSFAEVVGREVGWTIDRTVGRQGS